MRRTKLLLVGLMVVSLVVAIGGAGPAAAGTKTTAATIDPALQAQLAAAAPTDMLNVLVVLPRQEDVSVIKHPVRAQRRAAVVRALRARALADQANLLVLLAFRKAQGQVSKFTSLWIVNAIEVTAQPSVIYELAARSDVREIRAEVKVTAPSGTSSSAATAEANLALVNATGLWNLGWRGQGVVVANMDTGVDVTHPDLSGRWRGGTNSWYDPNGQHPTTPIDVNGHGTWTMGAMVAGAAGGTAIGLAPDARWIAVKIFNDRGTATSSGIHLGFQWLLDPDNNPATDDAPAIVNNSWTMSTATCNLEFQNDLRNLRAASILPIFAAGNYGPNAGTVMSPANNPEAFAVGATDSSNVIDPSSSRGPSACGQPTDPLLVAPGIGIRTTDLYGSYTAVSGTSIAAPHVAGTLALLLSALPNLTADRQEAAIEAGSRDFGPPGSDNTYGFGRLDALAAYNWLNNAPDFSVSASPSSATTPPGGTVSYTVSVAPTNGFTGDVAFSLGGLSASQATWSFNPPVVTGGTGSTQLTISTASSVASGFYPVTISAQSGSVTHTAAVTLDVTTPPDFGLTAAPGTQTVAPGAGATYNLAVTSAGGFTGDVALSVTDLPVAVGAVSVSPAVITTAGNATLTVTTAAGAPTGTYPLTVTGVSGSLTHTASITLVVTPPPDFGVAAAPATQTVTPGGTTIYTVAVAPNGFAGNVALTVNGLPPAVGSVSVAPAAVTGAGNATLTVTTAASAPAGTYPLTVTATSGSLSHTATVSLVVGAPPDFSISPNPASRSAKRGQSASYSISVAAIAGFTGNVSLSVQGQPAGATSSFSPNPVAAPGTSSLTIKTTVFTPRATYALVVTGTSGSVTHQVTVTLTVT